MKCPNCNSNLFQDYFEGIYVCRRCGYVADDKVFSSEPPLDKEGKIFGVGPPTYAWETHKRRSHISRTMTHKTPEEASRHYRLIRAETKTFLDNLEKVRNNLVKHIKCLAAQLPHIDSVTVLEAERLANKVAQAHLTKGRPIEVTAACILTMACNKTKNITSITQIARAAGVTTNQVRKGILFIVNKLGEPFSTPPAGEFIKSLVNVVLAKYALPPNLYATLLSTAQRVCDFMSSKGMLSGRNQRCVALAILLAILRKLGHKAPVKQDICELADVKSSITLARQIKLITPVVAQFMREKSNNEQ